MNYLNGFTRWIAGLSLALFAVGAQAQPAPAAKPVNMQKCYSCHDNIEEFHAKGKHAKVNCASCHTGTDEHLASKDKKAVKPVTIMDHRACATCHKDPHGGTLGTACAGCHGTRAFTVAAFQHPRFPEFFAGAPREGHLQGPLAAVRQADGRLRLHHRAWRATFPRFHAG
jgi:hypothetical protein